MYSIKEKAKHIENDQYEITITKVKDVETPDNQVVGKTTEESVITATLEDLKAGQDHLRKELDKAIKKRDEAKKATENPELVKILNAEQNKLQKNLQALKNHAEYKKVTKQLEHEQKVVDQRMHLFEERTRLLDSINKPDAESTTTPSDKSA